MIFYLSKSVGFHKLFNSESRFIGLHINESFMFHLFLSLFSDFYHSPDVWLVFHSSMGCEKRFRCQVIRSLVGKWSLFILFILFRRKLSFVWYPLWFSAGFPYKDLTFLGFLGICVSCHLFFTFYFQLIICFRNLYQVFFPPSILLCKVISGMHSRHFSLQHTL